MAHSDLTKKCQPTEEAARIPAALDDEQYISFIYITLYIKTPSHIWPQQHRKAILKHCSIQDAKHLLKDDDLYVKFQREYLISASGPLPSNSIECRRLAGRLNFRGEKREFTTYFGPLPDGRGAMRNSELFSVSICSLRTTNVTPTMMHAFEVKLSFTEGATTESDSRSSCKKLETMYFRSYENAMKYATSRSKRLETLGIVTRSPSQVNFKEKMERFCNAEEIDLLPNQVEVWQNKQEAPERTRFLLYDTILREFKDDSGMVQVPVLQTSVRVLYGDDNVTLNGIPDGANPAGGIVFFNAGPALCTDSTGRRTSSSREGGHAGTIRSFVDVVAGSGELMPEFNPPAAFDDYYYGYIYLGETTKDY
ncbi:hypothetical protein BJ508DRAFT_378698 [Ascobolus immersus RN42]|uniref:Uncharacterized protein n=1 Tax=Ascobolus immersus RN42 TaxID=1160509 RepID=A0A3N4I0M7_ASCIM|nr:hypothetical protein BJ508DRAFT_378698 [Ascobolus immersus RN42]